MKRIFRHKKRGSTYELLDIATAQVSTADFALLRDGDRLVVYRGEDGRLWARIRDEFFDGRFEDVTPARQWWPDEYLDEIMPAGTFEPSDWILGGAGDTWLIGPADLEDRKNWPCLVLRAGDEIAFSWKEGRGENTMLVYPNRTFELAQSEPADWSIVYGADDFENSGDSLQAFADDNAEMAELREGDEPLRIEIAFARCGETRFRLEVEGRTARLMPAASGEGEAA
jgi:hypothetical protein